MKYLLLLSASFLTLSSYSQHNNEFYNNGAEVTVQAGAEVYVMGDFHNYQATGLLRNNGFVEIQGHAFSDALFQQRGTGTARFTNADVNAGQTQFISGSYAARGGTASIGVNDGSFYNLELSNDQRIVWLNGAGNIADVRNSVNFDPLGLGAGAATRIITANPAALPTNGNAYPATFGLLNPATGNGNFINSTIAFGGNMSGIDNAYIQGKLRRAISPAGGTYGFLVGLEPAGVGAQRGFQYMQLILGANTYDLIEGFFQTGLDNSFAVATECSGYVINYFGGMDHGQWIMTDFTGAGNGNYSAQVWPQDDNFPPQSVWLVSKDNSIQGTADDCGPSPVGLSRSGFAGMGQFGVASSSILLPAELINIWAEPNVNHIDVGWKVASEFNLDYYNVQRSENGIDFETIATVDASGTTQSELAYAYEDHNVGRNKMYYYRYQSFDHDQSFVFSPVVNAKLLGSESFEESILLYPNPTNGSLYMEIGLEMNSELELSVLNSAGQLVEHQKVQGNGGNNVFALNANDWARGVYHIQVIEMRTGEVVHKKVVKE